MLKQRVITAVVLLLVLLPALFASDTRPFFGLTLLFIAAAGWEWARLNGAGALASVCFGAVVAAGVLYLIARGAPGLGGTRAKSGGTTSGALRLIANSSGELLFL